MKKKAAVPKKDSTPKTVILKYPRHSLEKVLRIPKAILDQNAGRECSDEDTVIRVRGVSQLCWHEGGCFKKWLAIAEARGETSA